MNPPPPPGFPGPPEPSDQHGDAQRGGPPGPPPGYVPFGAPGTPAPPSGQRTNGFAVASLVLGIVGIILCFLFLPWILAIVFGAIAIKQCNDDPTYSGRGLAIAGLVCGLVGAGLLVLILATGDSDITYDFGSVIASVASTLRS